ncbi:MAG: glycerol-3-phosphate 1-O-acyltransferase PlsY [Lysobacterales bacterium]|nr:MAG: glycerol-3-phosphate 1-O-acyltransferase PlsY [Xanthomonadales bacterium]
MILAIVLPVFGYLCGSLASAVIICRVMKLPDPREGGSGNPGATNVLRLGGKKAAALTLTGDVLKGLVPVLLAQLISGSPTILASTAVAAIVGHMYPVFFQFKGGKGVATTFGAVAALVYPVALFMGAVWVPTAMATRYASLASMAGAVAAPLVALVFIQQQAYVVALAIIAALLVYRHRKNIQRLRAGTESEINL